MTFARERRAKSGFVLIMVLIVIALLSLAGYAFTEVMFTEYKATRLQGDLRQTRLLAESGVEATKGYLALAPAQRKEAGGHFNNPERFQAIGVSGLEPGEMPGRFSIIAPPLAGEDPPKLRFGLANESAKLNLHAVLEWEARQPGAGRAALMNLPGMTEDLADAILDWIDADDVPREFGAESDYYSRLEPPYLPAQRVPVALEELCWARGVTPRHLFGQDANRNGYLDETELLKSEGQPLDLKQDPGPFGWSILLTLHSAEGHRRPDGQPKINLNDANLSKLYDQLMREFGQEWATFIIAYRQFGPYVGLATSATGQPLPPDLELPAKFSLGSQLDLIAVRVQVAHPEIPAFVLPCPFENNRNSMTEYLPKLMDATTVRAEPVVGRVDLNEAPREVLLAIPGMSAGLVEDILSKRGNEPGFVSDEHRHPTWLLQEGLVELEAMKSLLNFVTAGGDVFRAQTVGYLENGSIFRAEFLLDATSGPPRLISWTDLRRLGRGYDISLLGVTSHGDTSHQQTPTPNVTSAP